MSKIIGWLEGWFKSKSITSHTVGAAVLLVAGIIVEDETVRNFLIALLITHPKIAASIISLAGMIFKYSHSSSPAGTVAQAQAILAAPNPPTPTEVAATKGVQ